MGEIILRRAELEDIAEMAEIEKLCFADSWSEEAFKEEITENERALYIVAEAEGKVAAYAGLWAIFDEGHITNIAVLPSFRRKGIGRAVVGALLEASEKIGLTAFTLEVRESNLPAQALYHEFGFEAAGIRKGYYSDNRENAIIMWRRLLQV